MRLEIREGVGSGGHGYGLGTHIFSAIHVVGRIPYYEYALVGDVRVSVCQQPFSLVGHFAASAALQTKGAERKIKIMGNVEKGQLYFGPSGIVAGQQRGNIGRIIMQFRQNTLNRGQQVALMYFKLPRQQFLVAADEP